MIVLYGVFGYGFHLYTVKALVQSLHSNEPGERNIRKCFEGPRQVSQMAGGCSESDWNVDIFVKKDRVSAVYLFM